MDSTRTGGCLAGSVPNQAGGVDVSATVPTRWQETKVFFILAVVIWPIIATAFVGAYGLAFWIFFMFAGPPGPR
jgi:nitrate reductase NapE